MNIEFKCITDHTFLSCCSHVFVQCHLLDGLQCFSELFLLRLCADKFRPHQSQVQVQVAFSVIVSEYAHVHYTVCGSFTAPLALIQMVVWEIAVDVPLKITHNHDKDYKVMLLVLLLIIMIVILVTF